MSALLRPLTTMLVHRDTVWEGQSRRLRFEILAFCERLATIVQSPAMYSWAKETASVCALTHTSEEDKELVKRLLEIS